MGRYLCLEPILPVATPVAGLWRSTCKPYVPCQLTVTASTIFSPPHKAQMVSEGESQGRHLDTGGGFTRKHDRRGRTANSRCILDRQRRLPKTFRDHVRSASALSALKKLWSPTCPLNGSFQSPNCPLKGFFTRQTGFFSRKWPDGGRFFEPWMTKNSNQGGPALTFRWIGREGR